MDIEIKSAVVVLSSSADKILLNTNLPCPFPPAFDPTQEPASLTLHATYDTGAAYVLKHFGIQAKIINTRYSKTISQ